MIKFFKQMTVVAIVALMLTFTYSASANVTFADEIVTVAATNAAGMYSFDGSPTLNADNGLAHTMAHFDQAFSAATVNNQLVFVESHTLASANDFKLTASANFSAFAANIENGLGFGNIDARGSPSIAANVGNGLANINDIANSSGLDDIARASPVNEWTQAATANVDDNQVAALAADEVNLTTASNGVYL